jgi:hypothetical protein
MSVTRRLLSALGLLTPARKLRAFATNAFRRVLHPIRERLVRLPYPAYVLSAPAPLDARFGGHLEELRAFGITRVRGCVTPEQLARMKTDFESFVDRVAATGPSTTSFEGDFTVASEYADPPNRLFASNEPFAMSRALLEICLQPGLTAMINRYLGKQAYITQGVAIRIEPSANTGYGSFQWHHDAWGKRINMMVILTEVGEGDQHMTYAKGSNRLHHSYDKYANSRFGAEEYATHCGGMEILHCTAQPGDIYVFDSNGIHSGNRSSGRTRDTFIIEYTRLAHAVWAHRIPPEFLQGFSKQHLEPLSWILRQDRSKRPLAPPVNSWVGQLLRVDKWVL